MNWVIYAIALIFMIFATVHDLRKREVANWLTYTLGVIAILAKAGISVYENNWMILVYALIGMMGYYGIANLFYYNKVFAGGDAKLLISLGAILPYESWGDLFVYGIGFIFLLFFIGAIYTFIYSIFLAIGSWIKYSEQFIVSVKEKKKWIIFSFVIDLILILLLGFDYVILIVYLLILILPFMYIHLKSVEKACMVCLMSYRELSEGEWLLRDVKIGNKVIRKSVHGLSKDEVKFLRKNKKDVWVVKGIPFVPSFLATWIVTGFFYYFFEQLLRFGALPLLLELFGAS